MCNSCVVLCNPVASSGRFAIVSVEGSSPEVILDGSLLPHLWKKSCMSPSTLRQLWFIVETSQSQTLLNLDDNGLVQWLLKQLKAQQLLDHDETTAFSHYIASRVPLIRDLANSRTMIFK
ncbi:hypothetical protein [Stenomitos frigidus]|nr:hypothetical protein [Stenomitos frigidus]